MLKKILSVILAATMVLSLAACGSTGDAGKGKIKVGMVTDTGGVNDGSFNQSSWAGLTKAEKELGWKTELTVEDAMNDTINYLNYLKEK